jgi:hypothetical protein
MIRVAFVIGGYPPEEHKRRADVALSYSSEEVQVGIVDVKASPYFYGMTPAEIQLVAPAFIESFKQAEGQGYDAVVPLGTLELGVDGGKAAVDIPVVGPTEAPPSSAINSAPLSIMKASSVFCGRLFAAMAWKSAWSALA